jgi:hypothetical protein
MEVLTAETDEEELTTAGIRPAGFRGAAYDIHAAGKTPIHDGYRLKSCRLVHRKGDKCLTVPEGRAMLIALDED